jgi:hypothetical protein
MLRRSGWRWDVSVDINLVIPSSCMPTPEQSAREVIDAVTSLEKSVAAKRPRPAKTLDDPDFIGAEAALKRGAAKAVARDLAAGLEPVVLTRSPFLKTSKLSP